MRPTRPFAAIVALVSLAACGGPAPAPEAPTARIEEVLEHAVLAAETPPGGTTFLRVVSGRESAVALVQDGGPAAQVAVQRGLLDALTRAFGSPGVRRVTLGGAPTETLDRSDVSVQSGVAAYGDGSDAREALDAIVVVSAERLQEGATLRLGDGGTTLRGRFLRRMPLVLHVWRNGTFVLHVLGVGAFDRREIRTIARDMDARVDG